MSFYKVDVLALRNLGLGSIVGILFFWRLDLYSVIILQKCLNVVSESCQPVKEIYSSSSVVLSRLQKPEVGLIKEGFMHFREAAVGVESCGNLRTASWHASFEFVDDFEVVAGIKAVLQEEHHEIYDVAIDILAVIVDDESRWGQIEKIFLVLLDILQFTRASYLTVDLEILDKIDFGGDFPVVFKMIDSLFEIPACVEPFIWQPF